MGENLVDGFSDAGSTPAYSISDGGFKEEAGAMRRPLLFCFRHGLMSSTVRSLTLVPVAPVMTSAPADFNAWYASLFSSIL